MLNTDIFRYIGLWNAVVRLHFPLPPALEPIQNLLLSAKSVAVFILPLLLPDQTSNWNFIAAFALDSRQAASSGRVATLVLRPRCQHLVFIFVLMNRTKS